MGYKHHEEDFLAAAVDVALELGVSRVTFANVGERLGVADRAVVYYFPTKRDLLTRTVFALGLRLQTLLSEAFGDAPLSAEELMRRAWPILGSDTADPLFRVFFELVGLASAGIEPFDELGPLLTNAWVEWLIHRLDEPASTARPSALHVMALLDGLLLVRRLCGPEAADSAATAAGIGSSTSHHGR